jgi:hypothetical protein
LLGLDLGKSSDYSALVVLDWTESLQPLYDVPAIKRWQLGTSYQSIADWLAKFLKNPEAARNGEPPAILVVDETGVGMAVVEMIRRALVEANVPGGLVTVTITGGSAVTQVPDVPGKWRVAKKELASVLVQLFQGKRLQVAGVAERETLLREAQAFSVKMTEAGNETFAAMREGDHDDTVLALALACWATETLTFPPLVTVQRVQGFSP